MTGLVDWASQRVRMVLAFILLSIVAGTYAYVSLPKEGEPDIEIPALFISVPFPGISAEDSEKLLVRPMETELRDIDGLKTLSATAAESYAGVALEFEFGWDKGETIASVRDKMSRAEAAFPDGADQYTINEINFSEIPILVISLSGEVPERTLLRVARSLQDRIEAQPNILEAGLAGHRDEMIEVLIDPLRLEAYNVTAGELLNVVTSNNRLIAAGEVETGSGAYSIKIPSAFDDTQDVYNLPVKVNGDRVITLGQLADIRLTFEDATGTARYNGESTVALQVVKRKGFNVIDTVALVRQETAAEEATWPEELQKAVTVDFSMDSSKEVASMVGQLQGSVLTAIGLVMIVVLSALGVRSALLVGFAIPTSFLLCFALLSVFDISISNIVMFGLILAVGMLVDGAIVVVEYADKEIQRGTGPMRAYTAAARRMFWPIISSTATTLCAFLPMLFWPGVPGQFMGNLPVTLIFVLSASLVVALIFLPVVGGIAGRLSRFLNRGSTSLRARLSFPLRLLLTLPFAAMMLGSFLLIFRFEAVPMLQGIGVFMVGWVFLALFGGSLMPPRRDTVEAAGHRRTVFGRVISLIAGNPIGAVVAPIAVIFLVVSTFGYFGENNNGVEFFVEVEPERAVAYVRARGNLSLEEQDRLVKEVERIILGQPGVKSIFAFAGEGGLSQGPGGQSPLDSVGQVQIELSPWEDRYELGPAGKGKAILAAINAELSKVPGIEAEISEQAQGPAQGKPVHLRLKGDDWDALLAATQKARDRFDATDTLRDVEDTRPLPGIDWQIDVDVEKAGRFGTDVASIGAMVQLVTRGVTLDTMRVDSSDEEIPIRVRFPEQDRLLSTLDTLRVRTTEGLVPLANMITRQPVPKLGQIDRVDTARYFDVKADVVEGANANAQIEALTAWLDNEANLPPGVAYEWTGDQEEQEESGQFLMTAFAGALGLMFVILLTQFNSFYNSVLVLTAVVMSVSGALIGMLVMGQPFSIIMTGTGIVALAGIVVNNNIVLIDTYQEYSRTMPKIEAIIRTAEDRIRPVLLTTITTMAGLAPMMLGISVDFINGGYTIDAPTSLWWKQLATAVVFGLGIATVLTLVFTPSMLALRVWATRGAYGAWTLAVIQFASNSSRLIRDRALMRRARDAAAGDIVWQQPLVLDQPRRSRSPRAAE